MKKIIISLFVMSLSMAVSCQDKEINSPALTDNGSEEISNQPDAGPSSELILPEDSGGANCTESTLDQAYQKYVEPFVSGTLPTSCSQCHMTGIDIGMYAQDTPCQTLACMVDSGVVDLSNPESSSLLADIKLGQTKSSVFDVEKEYEAMLNWIQWSASCHSDVCGKIESACSSGSNAASTGINPIGSCSETGLLASFWDAVIIDKGRCDVCHSDWAKKDTTKGPCTSDADCDEKLQCLDGLCRKAGAYFSPSFFEGLKGEMVWKKKKDKERGLNTMYNMVALGQIDIEEPLNSLMLVKPLLENFQPTAIYGSGVNIPTVEPGVGVGVSHGGSNKFNFGCKKPPCPTSGVVDCRSGQECSSHSECANDMKCSKGFCRIAGSFCDKTYTNYIRFIYKFLSCK
ncbi:MAG TPA: hypothetical protein EYN66_11025 [Myxococcales bacterium]|nr:hypothetical protein [Myxococcales bacterium]